ncbi:MAG: N-acetyltransferase family protein [Dongiaceae bacterium]
MGGPPEGLPGGLPEGLSIAVSLRPVAEDDLPAIQRIYRRHVLEGTASFEEEPPDIDEMAARLAAIRQRGLPYIVAEPAAGGTLAGYAYASPYRSRSAYRFTVEDSIYLDPAFAGRGIGRALLTRLLADCAAIGMRQVVAVIGGVDNLASVRLHAALGFRQVGVLEGVGCKFGRSLNTVLMQRAL